MEAMDCESFIVVGAFVLIALGIVLWLEFDSQNDISRGNE